MPVPSTFVRTENSKAYSAHTPRSTYIRYESVPYALVTVSADDGVAGYPNDRRNLTLYPENANA